MMIATIKLAAALTLLPVSAVSAFTASQIQPNGIRSSTALNASPVKKNLFAAGAITGWFLATHIASAAASPIPGMLIW